MKSRAKRVPKNAVVGVEISDTLMRYVVLVPHEKVGYIIGTWGEQSIAFDAVEDGEIIEFAKVARAARALHEQVGVHRLAFSALAQGDHNARFREAFQVGGFREVVALPEAHALDILTRDTDGTSLPILYFTAENDLALAHQGIIHNRYPYPLEIYAIEEVRTYLEEHHESHDTYRVLGNFSGAVEEIVRELQEYHIPATPARVWRNVSDLEIYIPPILYHESFARAVQIANAYTMACGAYDDSHMPEVAQATFAPGAHAIDSESAQASSGAFGRWFEKSDDQVSLQPTVEQSEEGGEGESKKQAPEEAIEELDTNKTTSSS